MSGVFASAIGQFELPALDKKTSESFSDFLVTQSFSEKVFLINVRDSGYLKQWSERRIITRTSLVVPRVYVQWIVLKG